MSEVGTDPFGSTADRTSKRTSNIDASMGNDTWPQLLAPQHHDAEYATENCNQSHVFGSLISMRDTEENSLCEQAYDWVSGPSCELLLKITTEDNLFAESCTHRKNYPHNHL